MPCDNKWCGNIETIVAVASPPGGRLRGIVRLSGPQAVSLAARVVTDPLQGDRRAIDTTLVKPVRLPVTAWIMKGPRSYTREDVVELHLPGSPPVLRALVEELCKAGARLARPGEFTLRAFLNGRLDLAQAEAVEELIAATGEAEARAAVEQLEGRFSSPLREIEQDLLNLTADVEAAIDFVDQDIEIISDERIRDRTSSIQDKLAMLLESAATRRRENARPIVALFGRPNVGKSALFNRLTGSDAIVSDRAGTTRDLLEAELDGYRLIDAAGQFETQGVDREAVARAARAAEEADLVLHVVDASEPDLSLVDRLQGRPHLTVFNKVDLASVRLPTDLSAVARSEEAEALAKVGTSLHTGESVCTSALTGTGLEELRARIRQKLEIVAAGPQTRFYVTLRQQGLLREAAAALRQALVTLSSRAGMEFVALDLRQGLMALGAVTGRNVTEDLLGRIFQRFCLGK